MRSFRSLALNGKVGLIGALEGPTGDIDIHQLMFRRGTLHGIAVGSREMFIDLNRAVVQHKIKPIIDKVFPFAQTADALRHLKSGNFMGKIVISRS